MVTLGVCFPAVAETFTVPLPVVEVGDGIEIEEHVIVDNKTGYMRSVEVIERYTVEGIRQCKVEGIRQYKTIHKMKMSAREQAGDIDGQSLHYVEPGGSTQARS